jgi:hypothetical protein
MSERVTVEQNHDSQKAEWRPSKSDWIRFISPTMSNVEANVAELAEMFPDQDIVTIREILTECRSKQDAINVLLNEPVQWRTRTATSPKPTVSPRTPAERRFQPQKRESSAPPAPAPQTTDTPGPERRFTPETWEPEPQPLPSKSLPVSTRQFAPAPRQQSPPEPAELSVAPTTQRYVPPKVAQPRTLTLPNNLQGVTPNLAKFGTFAGPDVPSRARSPPPPHRATSTPDLTVQVPVHHPQYQAPPPGYMNPPPYPGPMPQYGVPPQGYPGPLPPPYPVNSQYQAPYPGPIPLYGVPWAMYPIPGYPLQSGPRPGPNMQQQQRWTGSYFRESGGHFGM